MSDLLPLVPVVFGVLWVTGWFRRQARKNVMSMGNTMVGAVGMWALLTWLWKNRKDALTVVAATTLGLSALVFAVVWKMVPELRWTITVPVVVAVICAYLAWDYKHTGGASLASVRAAKREESRARKAVLATHDNVRPRAAMRTQDGWRIDVDHTGPVDPQLVGQVLQSGDAKVVPSSKLGRSTIVLDDERRSGWAAFTSDVAWPGPRARKAGDDLYFGVDEDGQPVSIPWPGWGGRHVLIGGATGVGKSVLLRVLIAEMAYCHNVDLVLCDPKMIEFRGWSERAHVAKGVEATGRALDALHAEMMRRYEQMPDDDVEWDDSMGRWIVLVIDEIAELKKAGAPKDIAARQRRLDSIIAMGRAAGIGLVLATQRPSHDAMETGVRDNCAVRLGLGTGSSFGTRATMGDDIEGADCHLIPHSLKGALYRLVDRSAIKARAVFLGPKEPRRIAAETAQHKGEAAWLEVR